MSKELIGLILTGVGALFIIISVIVNMVRGFKKSWIRAVIIVCIALVAMFITPLFSSAVGNVDISAANLQVEGVTAKTLEDYFSMVLEKQAGLGDLVASNPDIVKLIFKLAQVVINIILFGIIFWSLKILSWIVYAIVMACTVDKKRRDPIKHNKKIKKEIKKGLTPSGELIPVPKKIWWGGLLIGIFTGLFVGVLTLMPVVQISKIIVTLNEYKVLNENNEQVGLIDGVTNNSTDVSIDNTTTTSSKGALTITEVIVIETEKQEKSNSIGDYLYSFEDSAICKIYRYTGLEGISSLPFNYLTSFRVNNTTFKLKDEVLNIGKIAQGALNISKVDFKNATKQEFENVLTTADEILGKTLNLSLVNVVGDALIPYYLNKIDNGEIKIEVADAIINDAIKDLAKEYKTVRVAELKEDSSIMIDSIKILNNGDVLVNYFKTEDKLTVINSISTETIDNFIDKVFEMNTVTKATPVLVNAGFSMIGDKFDIQIEKNTEAVEKDVIKSSMTNLLKNGVDLYKSIDKNDKFYLTDNSFDSLGKVLNEVKNSPLITNKTYGNIVNKLVTTLNNKIDETQLENEALKIKVKNSISKLNNINDWTQETTALKNSFTHVKVLFKDETFNEDTITNNLITLGKFLDSIKSGTIITDTDIKSMTKDIINDFVPDESAEEIVNIIKDAKNKVDNIPTNNNAYETEFGYVKILLDEVDKFKNIEDGADVSKEALASIGKTFDDIKPSILFGDSGKKVFNYIINTIDTTGNKEYESAVIALKERLNNFDPEKETYVKLFTEIGTIKETVTMFAELSNKDTVTDEEVETLIDSISSLESLEIMKYVPEGKDIGNEVVIEGLNVVVDTYKTKSPEKADDIQALIDNFDSYVNDSADNFNDKYSNLFDEFKAIVVTTPGA